MHSGADLGYHFGTTFGTGFGPAIFLSSPNGRNTLQGQGIQANQIAGVRILAFELRKENTTGAENGKLLAACSGTGTHPIVVSKSCGVPPSRALTTRGHRNPSP